MNSAIKQTQVIIIGAGPTGLSLACQLIRFGIDFIIIDKSVGVTAYSKALGVHARTLEIYEQLGIAEKAVAQGTIAGKVRMLAGAKVRGEVDLSRIGEGLSRYPYMLVLEQSKNERL
ncbi:MAG TPA: FAD-dependent monooxygenase, partial [Methylotenera sp.]|nr:FAD-dependent monooxygenase [Methylotenera sp.]